MSRMFDPFILSIGKCVPNGPRMPTTRADLRLVQDAGHRACASDAELDEALVRGRAGDRDGHLAVAGQLEHQELTGREAEALALRVVDDTEVEQLLHLGQRDDVGDRRLHDLVGVLKLVLDVEVERLGEVSLLRDVVACEQRVHRRILHLRLAELGRAAGCASGCAPSGWAPRLAESPMTSGGLMPARQVRPQRLQPTHLGSSYASTKPRC